MKRFSIGDKVFTATYSRKETRITCPDCGGSKRVKVTLFDGTEILIACGGCDPGGFEPSRGFIKKYKFQVVVAQRTVTGIRESMQSLEYEVDGTNCHCYIMKSEAVFETEQEAVAYGESQKETTQAEENKRFLAKTKNEKSWAWNYSHHMKCLAAAESNVLYHKSKVEICKAHCKKLV